MMLILWPYLYLIIIKKGVPKEVIGSAFVYSSCSYCSLFNNFLGKFEFLCTMNTNLPLLSSYHDIILMRVSKEWPSFLILISDNWLFNFPFWALYIDFYRYFNKIITNNSKRVRKSITIGKDSPGRRGKWVNFLINI